MEMQEMNLRNGSITGALTTGIIGTALGVLNGGAGLLNIHGGANGGNTYVTKDELNYVREISAKDSEIALLKSEQNTEVKIADVYERIMTRVNADARAQADWNAAQSVANAQMSSAIATNAASIAALQGICSGLTKTVIPISNVCPAPMEKYNSWTAPTNP